MPLPPANAVIRSGRTELRADRLGHAVEVGGHSATGPDPDGPAAALSDSARDSGQGHIIPAHDRHCRAVGRERGSRGRADAARPAGDHGDPAVQVREAARRRGPGGDPMLPFGHVRTPGVIGGQVSHPVAAFQQMLDAKGLDIKYSAADRRIGGRT